MSRKSVFLDRVSECGTVGCAVGWAALDPQFNEEGLRLLPAIGDIGFSPALYDEEEKCVAQGWEAVAKFFELRLDETYFLFCAGEYNMGHRIARPADVIERIDLFVTRFKRHLETGAPRERVLAPHWYRWTNVDREADE